MECKFQQPYFYMGLAEDEAKEERLAHIRETNEEYIGEITASKGNYVIRHNGFWGSYSLLLETHDTVPENFILESRWENGVLQLMDLVHQYGEKIHILISDMEKRYCKNQKGIMNCGNSDQQSVVFTAMLKGLRRELNVKFGNVPERQAA